jgi:hypothetical protein
MATPQAPRASGQPVPRRWTVEVDGIRWLPRMRDKARMSADGTLGPYLMGHSPVDKAALSMLGMTTDEFVRLANAQPDDASLLAALRARGFNEDRLRSWSAKFPKTYSTLIRLWDLDEGYRAPSALQRPLVSFAKIIERPLMALYRKISPAP